MKNKLALFITCLFLGAISATAQAPSSIKNVALGLFPTEGTGAFINTGYYLVMPFNSDQYTMVDITRGFQTFGNYTYRPAGVSGLLALNDSGSGPVNLQMQFQYQYQSITWGSYQMDSPIVEGTQLGEVDVFKGQAPSSIAGLSLQIQVAVGQWPFSESGKTVMAFSKNGTYSAVGYYGAASSAGLYYYYRINSTTGVLYLADDYGNSTIYLPFTSNHSGSYAAVENFDAFYYEDWYTTGYFYYDIWYGEYSTGTPPLTDGFQSFWNETLDNPGFQVGTFQFMTTQKPTVSITTPKNKATVSGATTTITGKASAKYEVAKVYYSINSSPWGTASGTTGWSATVSLAPGKNTIQVYSQDTSGNISKVSTVTITRTN